MTSNPRSESRVFLDLKMPQEDKWGVDLGERVYLKVAPAEIDSKRIDGWTIHELSKLAFDQIPDELVTERTMAGTILSRLADSQDDIYLTALGPTEGDYYIILTNNQRSSLPGEEKNG